MKIISNYKLADEKKVAKVNTVPKVAKRTIIDDNVVEIDLAANPEKSSKNTKPQIKTHTNSEGIVTAIDVYCPCGEKFTIKLEY